MTTCAILNRPAMCYSKPASMFLTSLFFNVGEFRFWKFQIFWYFGWFVRVFSWGMSIQWRWIWWICGNVMQIMFVFETPGGVLGFIWGGMFVSSSSSCSSCCCSDQIKWRAKFRMDWAKIFTEDSPSTLVMQISCIARFVQSLVYSTLKSTSDTMIFAIIALLLLFKSQKRVSGGFLGRWIC